PHPNPPLHKGRELSDFPFQGIISFSPPSQREGQVGVFKEPVPHLSPNITTRKSKNIHSSPF
ncbi:hypothetical protein, partial [Celerinatantimonas sp. YJH-8]|uniref:hypothetical protein n=1 Tax=Celerinatantimonas sp. YJH-8 TaxID=3228714 RepID=UPI0038C94F21